MGSVRSVTGRMVPLVGVWFRFSTPYGHLRGEARLSRRRFPTQGLSARRRRATWGPYPRRARKPYSRCMATCGSSPDSREPWPRRGVGRALPRPREPRRARPSRPRWPTPAWASLPATTRRDSPRKPIRLSTTARAKASSSRSPTCSRRSSSSTTASGSKPAWTSRRSSSLRLRCRTARSPSARSWMSFRFPRDPRSAATAYSAFLPALAGCGGSARSTRSGSIWIGLSSSSVNPINPTA